MSSYPQGYLVIFLPDNPPVINGEMEGVIDLAFFWEADTAVQFAEEWNNWSPYITELVDPWEAGECFVVGVYGDISHPSVEWGV